ncbi:MAG: formylglycine-generating enzyme family protein [Candidatus Electrothrix sp. AR4]|nr:formylglycine-generating enzyme family protein [Candidatus Electrothrix sp. AR4]
MKENNRTVTLPSGPIIDLVYVQGGVFAMGGDAPESSDREKPVHQVELSDFFIGKYPVTQEVWQAVMGDNPSRFKGEKRPVERISWEDIQKFFTRLNQQTGENFRLPTEAEWEYAARGGRYSQGCNLSGGDLLKQVGWYRESTNSETQDVGQLLANELGIHDISGNVWEWCQDWFADEYYTECHQRGIVTNPQGPDVGTHRVFRGGGYFRYPLYCRLVSRNDYSPKLRSVFIGFRLALPLQSVES